MLFSGPVLPVQMPARDGTSELLCFLENRIDCPGHDLMPKRVGMRVVRQVPDFLRCQTAHLGQEVRVVNLSSNKTITAIAKGDGLVEAQF